MDTGYKKLLYIIIILSIIGIIIAYILAQDYHFGYIFSKSGDKLSIFTEFSRSVCGGGSSIINCSKVSGSKYSKIFNIPQAVWGMFYLFLMAFISASILFTKERLRDGLAILFLWFLIFGSTYNLVLLFISIFLIKAICSLCVATYLVIWVSMGIFAYIYYKNNFNSNKLRAVIRDLLKSHRKALISRYIPLMLLFLIIAAGSSYGINYSLVLNKIGYFQKIRKSAIERILRSFPREPEVDLTTSDLLTIGDPKAPVVIVEFSDFLCPYCSLASRVIEQLIKKNPEKVKLIFMNYPLDIGCNRDMSRQLHAGSCLLARGGISAAMQGKFEEYHNIVFKLRIKNPGRKHIEQIARYAGLDLQQFFRDLDSPRTRSELEFHIDRAKDLNINSTPTIFINKKRFRYKPVKELLEKIIEQGYRAIRSDKRGKMKKK